MFCVVVWLGKIFADGLILMRTISVISSHNWHVWTRKILHLCVFNVLCTLCTCIFTSYQQNVKRWREKDREKMGVRGGVCVWMCKEWSERVMKNYMLSCFTAAQHTNTHTRTITQSSSSCHITFDHIQICQKKILLPRWKVSMKMELTWRQTKWKKKSNIHTNSCRSYTYSPTLFTVHTYVYG